MKAFKKLGFCGVLLLALLLSTVAYADTGKLRVALVTDLLTWDSHNYRSDTDLRIHDFVYDTLVSLNKNNEVVPRLATSWKQISPTQWEFELREGVKFSDGTPFNADIAKFSLERCSKAPRGRADAGMIESVSVLDEHKILVNLKAPCGGFLSDMSVATIAMLNPSAIAKAGKNFNTALPIGTGPYEVTEWIPNNKMLLKEKASHWGPKAPFKEITFKFIPEEATRLMALRNNEVDLIENVPPHEALLLEETYGLQLLKMPKSRSVWLGMNVGYGPLKDKRVREAIGLAINKHDIVKYVLEDMGILAETFIPLSVQKNLTKYPIEGNLKRAKELLAEAGYADGFEIKLTTTESRYLRDKQVSEVIQQQLKGININVKINVMEWGSFLTSLGKHEGELFLVGFGFVSGTDPVGTLRTTMESGSAFNYSDYNSSQFDNLVNELDQEYDDAARIKIMDKIDKLLIVDDKVVIPIYHMYSIFGASKNLEGVFIKPSELLDFSDAKFK